MDDFVSILSGKKTFETGRGLGASALITAEYLQFLVQLYATFGGTLGTFLIRISGKVLSPKLKVNQSD